jgi:hypothetical protein
MSILSTFINKTLSLLRLGNGWFSRLLSHISEAGRVGGYIETVDPSQADSLHQAIKYSDSQLFKREFECSVRSGLKSLGLGPVCLGIDVTEDAYWGENGQPNTRPKVHVKSDESWQYVNLAIVQPRFIPLMSLPYRQVDDLDTLVIDLLEYLRTLPLRVKLVLFDRGFYHWRLIDYLENRRGGKPWPYLIFVPKNKAMKRYINGTEGKLGAFRHEGDYSKDMSTWKPSTKIVICKGIGQDKQGNSIDWCFATNQRASLALVSMYRKRWNHETGFRIQDEAQIKSKSSHPLIRYFYHLVSMLLVLTWRIRNATKDYTVFKRYLKQLEIMFMELAKKPPPYTAIS